ncbi:hypothetical protein BH20ACT5_BH20ACT5_23940 [soil metagenome]
MPDSRATAPTAPTLRLVPPSPEDVVTPTLEDVVTPERRLRIALYSHDALGLGHLRRNLALATAFTADERCPDVLLFAGALESTGFSRPEGCDLVTLPSLRKDDDGRYAARQLSFDLAEVVALRSTILASAMTAFVPDVLIVDKHPLGAFEELRPSLEALRANGRTKIVLGLRDILDDPATSIAEWESAGATAAIEEFFDQVWVYGDPTVYDCVTAYELPEQVAAKVVYTGYLGDGRTGDRVSDEVLPDTDFVLGMVGGGQDGGTIAEAFAAMPVPTGHHGVLVTGPQMAEPDRARVVAAAGGRRDMTVLDSVEDGERWIRAAAAVITMGGYNTVCEVLASGTPGLVVPRVVPRREQLVRAERLAALGALDMLHPADLSPAALGGWAAVAIHRASHRPTAIDLGGLARLPALVAELTGFTNDAEQHSRGHQMTAPDRIGYVLKMYPRFSETFIVSELTAREATGEDIEIFSLRPPSDGRFHEALARVRANTTYLTHQGRRASDLWALLAEAGAVLPGLPGAMPELLAAEVGDAAQAVELALLVRQRRITHLHAHFASVATTVARLTALLTGVPYSFTAHAKDIFHADVDQEDLRRKLADAQHVVTVSRFNLEHLREQFGPAADQVTLVYNGLDLDAFGFDPSVRRPTICSVGRLVEKKGFDVLIDACALLAAGGRTVDCEIAGAGPLHLALEEQIANRGLTGSVRLTGPMPQSGVRDLLRRSAVFAAPCVVGADGNRDGLPTVLLEAMALGTPCVGTDVTGIPEVIRHEDTGLMVSQHDAAGLAEALGRLLDDERSSAAMAGRARSLVEEDFDSRRQARDLALLMSGHSVRPLPLPAAAEGVA